ncbi:MAG: MetQ/NlpA family ABC transporter substrate-binding protein [Defluviitaleaceae bacterium]|nr:MetQ/NlpA family ABC transporter substrate-binding protein [Defluviitaleaceae bacterium]
MKNFFVLAAVVFMMTAFAGCGSPDSDVLRIGASPVPHAIILEYIADELAQQGVAIQIIEFSDFTLPNPALFDAQIDVNYFQHRPFLERWIDDSGNELAYIASIHIEPMGIYSQNLTDLSQVPQGGRVAIPNDATNGGRALMILESAGLLGLTEGIGIRATVHNIEYNPLGLTVVELDAPLVPVALGEVDIAVINTNFALGIGLNPTRDALYMEPTDSPFANILATRTENANSEAVQILADTLRTERVRNFILERFEGAVVPVF